MVGAPRFGGSIPACPENHPGCEVAYVGNAFGRGSSKSRFVDWAFPASAILRHTVFERDSDTSSGGGGTVSETFKDFYVDTQGSIYDPQLTVIGSIREGVPPQRVPHRRTTYIGDTSGSPMEPVQAETRRFTQILEGRGDPGIKPPDTYATDKFLPWGFAEMGKLNNPGAQKWPGYGMFAKKAWTLIQPSGMLYVDGMIQTISDKKPRPVRFTDETNLRTLARLHGLGEPPPR